MALGDAQTLLDLIRQAITQQTRNSARYKYSYGVAINSSAYAVSAYLNASEFATDYIQVPDGWAINSGDYIKVAEDEGGKHSVDQILPYTQYSRMVFDFRNQRMLLGDGSSEPATVVDMTTLGSGGSGGSRAFSFFIG